MNDPSFPDALPAQYKLHWYVLERVLGQGGFGITYLARDSNLEKPVAIKEYLPVDTATRRADATVSPRASTQSERYESGLDGFIREARTLARFSHPNIVRVHSVFQHNNTAYMVMEYEEGETLAALLERRQTLSESELHAIMLPILDGLALVHAAGFIHRDIKPENILIRKDGSPVLLDFGSARAGMGQSRTVTILVAPGYAPFEQYYANGESQGPWTDIYSLGATCYRAIAGVAPMDAIARSKGVLGSTREMLVAASEIGARRYSPQFLKAVDHALAFSERERPQTLDEWRRELTGGVDRPAVVAAATAPALTATAGPAPEPTRKREMLAWGGLALALLGLAFMLWQRAPSTESERIAQIERQLGTLRGASEPASAVRAGTAAASPVVAAVNPAPAPPVAVPSPAPSAPVAVAAPNPTPSLPTAMPNPSVPATAPAGQLPTPAKLAQARPEPPAAPVKGALATVPRSVAKPPDKAAPAAPAAGVVPSPAVATATAAAAAAPVAPAVAPAPAQVAVVTAPAPVVTPAPPPAPVPALREEPKATTVARAPDTAPPSDAKEAFSYYRTRALAGDADGRFRVGEMYAQGNGVAQNLNQAYVWFGLAAASGHAGARARQAQVAERLQPAEVKQADRQVERLGKNAK